jgi:amino acid synthesis protein
MSEIAIQRIATFTQSQGGLEAGTEGSVRQAWAAAVISNPFINGVGWDSEPFAALGELLGMQLGRRALEALACEARQCSSYGKGAILGAGSEIEQGAAILHPRLGKPLRSLLGRGKAIIPSSIKHGAPGANIDIPLHGIDDEWDFKLLNAIEAGVPGAPRHDELVIVIALAIGGRPCAR